MIKKLLLSSILLFPSIYFAQVTFTNATSNLVNPNLTSGVAIGVCDMNGDGLDDIIRLDDARYLQIEYQNTNGVFTWLNYGNLAGTGNEWGLCIADVDENGYNDIFTGGAYNGKKLLIANSTGTNYTSNSLSGSNIFIQNLNFIDIDNNGTIDIFACHDEGVSSAYNNDGNGNMTQDNAGLINAVSTIPSDNSGNYGSIWVDYDNDGDQDLYISKCRLGVSNPNDGRRVNLLFQNDGSGNFTEVGVAAGLVPYAQSWSANFEDIDNDGDLDCVLINHDVSSIIYVNNGNGTFTDITATSGIATELNDLGSGGIQVIMEDFDNDTFIDLFITSRYASHALFKNNGDLTFSKMPSPFGLGNDNIQSAAVGDLNNDGFIDVVAGFAIGYNSPTNDPDILFYNNGNSNNWSEIRLQGGPSNINGIGARIELHTATGIQIREVRSGESYGTMNSLMTHFGLGTQTAITKIVVKWPSGIVDELFNPNINESILIIEGATLGDNQFTNTDIKIYPNPTKDNVTIEGLKDITNASYSIFDISGKMIKNNSMFFNNEATINLSSYDSGVYFVHLKTDSKKLVYKVVKE
ncbi:FG-GAP-like repeat-containing protein [Meridianimaribacter flavus]|uniref:Secreted protein (Por secretion system target) n=1 Tax=Meridianimaribacter flavus TaxID=571115 RepID=A0ABY2G6R9_9FLAO|nr:FG-GAP-like repeat-containing protein [Meridianimaribacter flavus]TDY11974.1 putative secreted protein (Por secretion system target) [Meridianimaribacter flavus]